LVASVLSATGNDPHSFINQLNAKNPPYDPIEDLVMGLLTSAKSKEVIAKGITTEENASKLAAMCRNFLNQTWLDSPRMRPFDGGTGDQRHMLTYNQNRIRAQSVTVTAIAEVLGKEVELKLKLTKKSTA
jgi:hypothetical protein